MSDESEEEEKTCPWFDEVRQQWINAWNEPTFAGQPPDAGLQPNGSWKLSLVHPITIGKSGEPKTEIVFASPTGKAMRSKPLKPKTCGDVMSWAARELCALTSLEVDLLQGEDCDRFEELSLAFFTGLTRAAGCGPLVNLLRHTQDGEQASS